MARTSTLLLITTLAASMLAGAVEAKPCRDAKGKFIACPAPAAAQTQRCRTPNGAFAKCSAPGAKPVVAAKTGAASNTTAHVKRPAGPR